MSTTGNFGRATYSAASRSQAAFRVVSANGAAPPVLACFINGERTTGDAILSAHGAVRPRRKEEEEKEDFGGDRGDFRLVCLLYPHDLNGALCTVTTADQPMVSTTM